MYSRMSTASLLLYGLGIDWEKLSNQIKPLCIWRIYLFRDSISNSGRVYTGSSYHLTPHGRHYRNNQQTAEIKK